MTFDPHAAISASTTALSSEITPDDTGVRLSAREVLRKLHLAPPPEAALDNELFVTRRLREGEALYRAGDPFHSFYVVRAGFFKTALIHVAGGETVLSFPMQNDVIGTDGLADGHYPSEAIALVASEVIVVPYHRLTDIIRHVPGLERSVYCLLSRELVRDQALLFVLSALAAEGRVAAFLLSLSERFGALGYSRSAFNLRMTRQEIGSYLGMKLETVSRALSAFATKGLIKINLKSVEIVDPAALRQLMDESPHRAQPERVITPMPLTPRLRATGRVLAPADRACA